MKTLDWSSVPLTIVGTTRNFGYAMESAIEDLNLKPVLLKVGQVNIDPQNRLGC